MVVSSDQFDAIIQDMLGGLTLSRALTKHGVTPISFYKTTDENPIRAKAYAHAQMMKAELIADEVIEIADTDEDPQRARNRIDSRKWVASKLKPHKYGDRIELAVSGTIDLSATLAEAKRRALLPGSYPEPIDDAQVVETPQLTHDSTTGSQPVEKQGDSIFD